MAITDAPIVTLAGTALAPYWTVNEKIVLGGLAITWGRKTHLDDAKASQLKLEVLDTDGHLSSAVHLTGQPVTVARGDGRIIFRGRVDDYDVDQIHVQDPDLFYRRRVWRYVITAASKVAELGQAMLAGPGDVEATVLELGPNYWPNGYPQQRIDDLMAAGADAIVDDIDWTPPYPSPFLPPSVRIRASDDLSVLEHIEGIYKASPLNYVEYRPYNNTIVPGQPVETSGLALKYTGGKLRIEFADGVAGRSIPARTIVMPSGYTARTGINDAIDVVRASGPVAATDHHMFTVEEPTSRNTPALGRREHRVQNEIELYISAAEDSGEFEWPFSLDLVSSEYGNRPGIGNGFHTGIDFSGGAAALGEDIKLAGPGKFVGSRTHPDWGNNAIIDHGNGLRTVYCHMIDPVAYPVGTTFAKGDVIGRVGNTGLSTGPHLHFETLVNGDDVNPRWFMTNKTYGENHSETYHDEWLRNLAKDTADMLDQLNGKLTLPTVRFDFRRFDYHNNVESIVIDSYVHPDRALYFPGSVFNVAMDAAAAHQIIGGTLVYFEGWTHDVTLAPAISTAGPGITIDELVEADEPTLGDFDDDITLADLGNVSHGVADE